MAIFQRAYDTLRTLDGSIGDYVFVGMIVNPYPEDDEWHEEDEDYIEFYFHNKVNDGLRTVIIPCSKNYARKLKWVSDCICKESTWYSFGICDDGYSKVNFDYWMQMGAFEGYTEGE